MSRNILFVQVYHRHKLLDLIYYFLCSPQVKKCKESVHFHVFSFAFLKTAP
jgi:hypothetical protein